jgi:hypothetical protein
MAFYLWSISFDFPQYKILFPFHDAVSAESDRLLRADRYWFATCQQSVAPEIENDISLTLASHNDDGETAWYWGWPKL